jgi:hypothetical protein
LLSLKVRGTVVLSRTAATEEVRIKRFRELPCFNAEFRIDVVPRTAGMMRSIYVLVAKIDDYPEKIRHTIGFGSLVVKWRCGVGNGVDTLDGFVKCTILGDIFYNDELKSIPVTSEFVVEEGALR